MIDDMLPADDSSPLVGMPSGPLIPPNIRSPLVRAAVASAPQGPRGAAPSGGNPMDSAISRREKQIERLEPMIDAAYGQQEQGYAGMQQSESALKDLLLSTQQRLGSLQYGPSEQEARNRAAAAAVSGATYKGGFGSEMGRAAGALADTEQQKREGALLREQLMAKYGIDAQQADLMAQQYGAQAGQMRLGSLTSQLNSAQSGLDRTTNQAMLGAMKNANNPVTIINGQPQVNSDAVAAKGAAAQAQQQGRQNAMVGALTPEVLDAASEQYMRTGQIPFALARQNPLAGPAIIAAAMHKAQLQGGDAQSLVYGQQLGKAGQQAMGRLTTQQTLTGSFEKTTERNLAIVEEMSDKVDRTGSPAANRWLLAGRKAITGDSDVTKLDNAVTTAVSEYGKVVYNATGSQAISDKKVDEVNKMLQGAQNPQTIHEVIALMRREMDNRMAGFSDQQDELRHMMESNGVNVPPPAAAGVKHIANDQEYNALPHNTVYVGPDGKTRTKK